ncbi:hypothetical protein N7457_004090 [Penicillium paradoxum]|uniref:uncharacterized protein n=1 Tax=Penicillium paradoxum TaxID=176176 RepID=UPI0025499B15|nr:uncharacterized protein N7457_004090 [Penicillium paradoxum]KAJ5782316.1 hypothetical protein N7457_004090 [Penicillium paradoxum]
MHTSFIEISESLENTGGNINIKLLASLASICNSHIYAITSALDVDPPPTELIMVRVAVYIRAIIYDARNRANIITCVVEPTARSNSGVIPGQITTEGLNTGRDICVVRLTGVWVNSRMKIPMGSAADRKGPVDACLRSGLMWNWTMGKGIIGRSSTS